MEPLTTAALISAGINIFGGIMGGNAAAEEAKRANALLDAAMRRIESLPIPNLTKDIIYEQLSLVGDYSPQTIDKTLEEYAPLALIKEDPINKIRQEQIYSQVQQSTLTGLDQQAKLGLEQARRKTAQDILAQMASIESKAKAQGQLGGGAELALKARAAQEAADRQAMENIQIAANAQQTQQAQQKALFDMASGMRASDYDKEMRNVLARNQRNETLMKYSADRANLNFQERVNKQNARTQMEQTLANANVQTSQQEALRKGYLAPLEMSKLQFEKEKMMANLMGNKANVHMGLGGAKAQAWGQAAGGAGTAALAAGGAFKPNAATASSAVASSKSIPLTADIDTSLPIDDEYLREYG